MLSDNLIEADWIKIKENCILQKSFTFVLELRINFARIFTHCNIFIGAQIALQYELNVKLTNFI